jgi:endonuclease YncB( thermonuclease family)
VPFISTASLQKEEIERVIDGDTVVTSDGERIRIADIDSPELGTPEGHASKEMLNSLLEREGYQVYIEREGLDKYGRTLGTLYSRVGDQESVGDEMIERGGAREWETREEIDDDEDNEDQLGDDSYDGENEYDNDIGNYDAYEDDQGYDDNDYAD